MVLPDLFVSGDDAHLCNAIGVRRDRVWPASLLPSFQRQDVEPIRHSARDDRCVVPSDQEDIPKVVSDMVLPR